MPKLNKEGKISRFLITVMIGTAGGFLFQYIRMPLPWMLGPMVAMLAGTKILKTRFSWPACLRDWGLMIIGYSSGLSFDNDAYVQIMKQLPWMLGVTVVLLAFSAFLAFLISKLSRVDYISALTGGIPGGLTQMIMLSEEMEGISITAVTFFQVIRLMMVVACVPLLVFSPLYSVEKSVIAQAAAEPGTSGGLILKIAVFSAVCLLCALAAKKIRFPTPYLVGPILGTAILNASGFEGPALSPILMIIAQLCLGCYLGLLIKPESLRDKSRTITFSVVNGIVLILFSLLLSHALVVLHGMGAVTAFLCLAPGGAEQMSLIAGESSADVSLVTAYQLFRMLFINFAVPPSLRCLYRHCAKKRSAAVLSVEAEM